MANKAKKYNIFFCFCARSLPPPPLPSVSAEALTPRLWVTKSLPTRFQFYSTCPRWSSFHPLGNYTQPSALANHGDHQAQIFYLMLPKQKCTSCEEKLLSLRSPVECPLETVTEAMWQRLRCGRSSLEQESLFCFMLQQNSRTLGSRFLIVTTGTVSISQGPSTVGHSSFLTKISKFHAFSVTLQTRPENGR